LANAVVIPDYPERGGRTAAAGTRGHLKLYEYTEATKI
jgi:hypothetical protein